MPVSSDYTRLASFVERYVIARAAHFAVGNEREDAWIAMLDAAQIYAQIQGTCGLTNEQIVDVAHRSDPSRIQRLREWFLGKEITA